MKPRQQCGSTRDPRGLMCGNDANNRSLPLGGKRIVLKLYFTSVFVAFDLVYTAKQQSRSRRKHILVYFIRRAAHELNALH